MGRVTRLVVSGCCGRMGSLIVEEALKLPGSFELVGALEQEGHPRIGRPLAGCPRVKVSGDSKGLLAQADLLIEFTTPEATLAHAQAAADAQVPMLIGTTGFSPDQLERLKAFSKRIPIFWSPNMSIGIVVVRRAIGSLFNLLKQFELDGAVRISLSETHHVKKKDAPSGTARLLAEEVRKVTGRSIKESEIEAKREGEVVGIHSVTFDSGAERITLEHEAKDRRVFAQGAVTVARHFHQLCSRPGWYGMDQFISPQ
ncbi:MAG: 4-hydroxy-tetrahydrodipicolinate reductase [Candidatus Omnitrophica bacterium]|nr:4-hydroxy-tetrahydrodipicolinate reductase [Candidatus Omnitrophota bacterium]